ncbi:MAG: hypothetical protein EOM50_04790 [Erysipelotrichia bacterium]|nr:hypothetical protein [Erysipelotrichia bacterium]NCC54785.1 hypothetical protein [Erysipelotrichia bacterium]
MKLSKLMQKVVVNTVNGEMLGYVVDMEIDMNAYVIKYFIVEEKSGVIARFIPWIFKAKTMQVSVEHIHSIGSDVMLIESDKVK